METTLATLQRILMLDYPLAQDVLTRSALLEDLGIDSLGTTELLFNIEDTFHLVMPCDVVILVTLGDVVDYVDRLVAAQAGAQQPDPVLTP